MSEKKPKPTSARYVFIREFNHNSGMKLAINMSVNNLSVSLSILHRWANNNYKHPFRAGNCLVPQSTETIGVDVGGFCGKSNGGLDADFSESPCFNQLTNWPTILSSPRTRLYDRTIKDPSVGLTDLSAEGSS